MSVEGWEQLLPKEELLSILEREMVGRGAGTVAEGKPRRAPPGEHRDRVEAREVITPGRGSSVLAWPGRLPTEAARTFDVRVTREAPLGWAPSQ